MEAAVIKVFVLGLPKSILGLTLGISISC